MSKATSSTARTEQLLFYTALCQTRGLVDIAAWHPYHLCSGDLSLHNLAQNEVFSHFITTALS